MHGMDALPHIRRDHDTAEKLHEARECLNKLREQKRRLLSVRGVSYGEVVLVEQQMDHWELMVKRLERRSA